MTKFVKSVVYGSYTNTWFDSNIPLWETLIEEQKSLGASNTALEIGSFEGKSAVFLANKGFSVTCIDPFIPSREFDEKTDFNEVKNLFLKNTKGLDISVIESKSLDALCGIVLEGKKFDLIYIDGDHMPTSVISDAILAYNLLNDNGLLIFDDYIWDETDDPSLVPKTAIDVFLNLFSSKFLLLEKNFQVILRKLRVTS